MIVTLQWNNVALSLLLFSSIGCLSKNIPEAPVSTDVGWFEDVTHSANVSFEHVRGRTIRYWFPEIMSGGAAWFDFDGDGYMDLYLVQGGELKPGEDARPGNHLLHNLGDGTFADVTELSGTGDTGYGMGVAAGDFDDDGDIDLYVTNVGPNVLYRNNGNGTFSNVSQSAGVDHAGWGTSAAFIDYDLDGYLDLYVVNYVIWSPEQEISCFAGGNQRDYCQPENYKAPATDVLYHNNGDGTFTDVTRSAGIARARGNGLGITTGDFDGDGHIDLYVANDGNPNQLWMNRGDGTFVDRALPLGSALNRQGMAEAGMGVVAVDVENDGDLDLFMTHLREETNTLYLNTNGVFEDATIRVGLAVPSISYTGFGVGFADFDLDGLLDIYIANGRVGKTLAPLGKDPFGEPNQIFRGLPSMRFEEIRKVGEEAVRDIQTSRAAAFADYDNDGDVDVIVVNNGGPARLLQNQAPRHGEWISFRVVDRFHRVAVGAMLGVWVSGRVWWLPVETAFSYQSSNDPRVHFGLGPAVRVDSVEVVWPGGIRERFGPFEPGHLFLLGEGNGLKP